MISLFRRRPKREIFSYFDGKQQRAADPMLVFRKMAQHDKFVLDKHVGEMQPDSPPKIQLEASQIAIEAMRDIFGLKPWNEETQEGLTEAETLNVLNEFTLYVDGLKKNGNGQPT